MPTDNNTEPSNADLQNILHLFKGQGSPQAMISLVRKTRAAVNTDGNTLLSNALKKLTPTEADDLVQAINSVADSTRPIITILRNNNTLFKAFLDYTTASTRVSHAHIAGLTAAQPIKEIH